MIVNNRCRFLPDIVGSALISAEASAEIPAMIIWVVAVALVAPDRRVLLQRRRPTRDHGGLWEFPGGKIEPGETPDAAALREIREELGVELDLSALQAVSFAAEPANPATRATPAPGEGAPRQTHVILLYACRRWRGEPASLDAEAIAWVTPEQCERLPMPPLDYPLARALSHLLLEVI